ncbi:D-alanyl-D-alanine carboxypeptidase family protein [Xanthobacter autotrophicus DSM 431]|uniref:serine hydrolase n=1 Tax=Xanthobacter nonsaccharivorans TaxID=3119912 RepID=UPI0037282340
MSTTVAEARPRKKTYSVDRSKDRAKPRKQAAASAPAADKEEAGRWHYGSSAIIVDANTGKVLYEDNPDALRHPASITKIMTLYLLFEQLEQGALKLDSPLQVSAKAAAQQPSKLGVRPGSTIEVEDAIKAIVTRSANDVAVVIAENIGGSESEFAEMMTRKARALGMSRTTFRNASGLPNPNQVTTARDMSILGRAVQDRFPRQYKYFATRTFYFRGQAIGNHNRLLGRIEGVDGIKTGYTQASGFNLVSSIKRDGRYLVGVVLGGSSGAARDNRMANLLTQNLATAYAGGRTAPKVTEVADAAIPVNRTAPLPTPVSTARAEDMPHPVAPLPKPQVAELDPATTASLGAGRGKPQAEPTQTAAAEPIRPVTVKTVAVGRAAAQASAAATPEGFGSTPGVLGYLGPSGTRLSPAAAAAQAAAEGRARSTGRVADASDANPAGKDQSRVGAPAPVRMAAAAAEDPLEAAARAARVAGLEPDDPYARALHASQAPAARPTITPVSAKPVRTASLGPVAAPAQPAAAPTRSGWQIQIGAYGAEREARAKLDTAKSRAKALLGSAESYTEKVSKSGTDLYRARFAGLNEKGAREACRLLKRNDFDCITIRN